MMFLLGLAFGAVFYLLLRYGIFAFYTVDQNERAVVTSFGRAERVGEHTTLDDPIAESLGEGERQRYAYPQVRVVGPGGPYIKMPWQEVHKVTVAIQTVNIAYDPDAPTANQGGTMLEAVTKDQLNIGITGQMRFKVSERNLYAFLFGVKRPIAHVMGYFVSILRERIANFDDPRSRALPAVEGGVPAAVAGEAALALEGVSINDLRKNLNELNQQMTTECASAPARYGIELDASLITGFDPPSDIESALAAISTAHNEVSAEISAAQAGADQKIEQSKRAVEIETMRAQAEVQPLRHLADQLALLKEKGPAVLAAFRRNVRLDLFARARRIFLAGDVRPGGEVR